MDFNFGVEGNILRGWERNEPAVVAVYTYTISPGSTPSVIRMAKVDNPEDNDRNHNLAFSRCHWPHFGSMR